MMDYLMASPDLKLIIISALQIIAAIIICTITDKKKRLAHNV
jgi:hypothetical protein